MSDRIVRDKNDRLLLCRGEYKVNELGRLTNGVCRLRQMHADGTATLLHAISGFTGQIVSVDASTSGQWFAVDGDMDPSGRQITILNSETLQTHRIPCVHTNRSVRNVISEEIDCIMQLVQAEGDPAVARLYRLSNGQEMRDLPFFYLAADATGRVGFLPGNDARELYDLNAGRLLFQLRTLPKISSYEAAFSPDGLFVAWANENGTVSVCDIERVQQELAVVNNEK